MGKTGRVLQRRAVLVSPNAHEIRDLAADGLPRRVASLAVPKLREAGFYKEWQERFGKDAWSLLEDAVGKLA